MTDSRSHPDELDPAAADGAEDKAQPQEAEAPPEGANGSTSAEPEISLDDIEAELDKELSDVQDQAAEELQREYNTLNDRHLRLAAEFNNFRRRTEAERLDLWTRAQADFVAKFLDVLDDLQRVASLDLSNATVETIMEGIDLVERKFMRMLADSGVEVIDPVGEAFDPERMDAMMRVPAESDDDDDRVQQVFQKGYELKGQLVRPARVSVLKTG